MPEGSPQPDPTPNDLGDQVPTLPREDIGKTEAQGCRGEVEQVGAWSSHDYGRGRMDAAAHLDVARP